MIIVRVVGGLGNQMFQYALGRALAEVHDTELKLEISSFAAYPERSYKLDAYSINASIANIEEIDQIIFGTRRISQNYLMRQLNKIIPINRKRIITENSFGFNPKIFNVQNNTYLIGYWQSYKYFGKIVELIRQELTEKKDPKKEMIDWYQRLKQCNSVSIHIRRGDYVSNQKTNEFHGLCSIDYYEKSIQYIAGKISSPRFYVFSDDILWARKNLRINYPIEYVSNITQGDEISDLYLMKGCKHHIIANSSFSWWGAWLSNSPNQITIAPKKWFKSSNVSLNDLIPGNWKCF